MKSLIVACFVLFLSVANTRGQCPNGRCPGAGYQSARPAYYLPTVAPAALPVGPQPAIVATVIPAARTVDGARLDKALAKMRSEGRTSLTEAEFEALFQPAQR